MAHQPVRQLTSDELNGMLSPITDHLSIEHFLSDETKSKYSATLKCWSHIAAICPGHESKLYNPLVSLLNLILASFGVYGNNNRNVLTISNRPFKNLEGYQENAQPTEISLKSSPALCAISLSHNHFPDGISIKDLGYNCCASPIEVMTDGNIQGEDRCLDQCAMYARQCLAQQTGRRFVFVPLLTESRVKLYRFDRGGVVTSEWINYHDNPEIFVRIVLLISGVDAIELGLNPFLTWEGQAQFITINAVKYKVECVVTSSRGIRGRGTCVWRVRNMVNDQYVIKYQWRTMDRTPEWKLLEKLKGLPGVVNMVSHCVDTTLSALRSFEPSANDVVDREAAFIVMDAYGPSITNFSSPEEFLVAFRDAVAGHQNIWNTGIVHRDISINNILFGKEGAPAGSKGVVIDLDLATTTYHTTDLWKADWTTGTRAFQSHLVSRSERLLPHEILAHDYLDDLESFFWVLLWVIIGFRVRADQKSEEIVPQPKHLLDLQTEVQSAAAALKFTKLSWPQDDRVDPSWPLQFTTLKFRMANFLLHHANIKSEAPPTLPSHRTDAAKAHYAIFLGYIDQTIQELNGGAIAPFTTDFKKEEKDAFDRLAEEAALPASGSVELEPSSTSASLPPISSSDIPHAPLIAGPLVNTADTLSLAVSDLGILPDADVSIVDKRRKRDENDDAEDVDLGVTGDSRSLVTLPKAKKLKTPLSSAPTLLS